MYMSTQAILYGIRRQTYSQQINAVLHIISATRLANRVHAQLRITDI